MSRFAYKLATVGFLCISTRLAAQRVDGVVHESSSTEPVAGAVVSMLDSAGHLLTRTVTGADGHYRLVGNGSGTSVHVIRIGFRPATRTLGAAAFDTTLGVDIAFETLPMLLEAVDVQDQSRCPSVDDAPAAFALWEQARTALLAGVVARDVDPPTVRMVSYERTLDSRGSHIDEQLVHDSIYIASQPVVSARTAAEFAARGYRALPATGNIETYFAPDADVLLDSTFLGTHCISLRQHDADHADEIGVAFAPTKGQDSVVDVDGVLWLNRAVPALDAMNFRFTNLSSREMDAGAGGDLVFTVMPNGVAMISRWNLHLPSLQRQEIRLGGGRSGSLVTPGRVVGFRDSGGELAEAAWHDGLSWLGPLATISGHVVVKETGAPAANARVRFRGARTEMTTDSAGAFTLPMTVPGPYVVEAADGVMAALGVSSISSANVTVGRAPIDNVRVVLPSRKTAIATLCAEMKAPSPHGNDLLVGRVQFANGAPAPDAYVRAEWGGGAGAEALPNRFSGRSDATGTFEMCGAPDGVALTLSAARDTLVSTDAVVAIDSVAHVAQVTLTLATPSGVALPKYRRRRVTITDAASHTPMAGVEALDALTDRVLGRSSVDGTVSLASLAPGQTVLHLRKVGYELRTLVVNVEPGDTLPVTVPLMTVTQLAAMKITVAATSRLAYDSGFEDRALQGLGHFLRLNDFERREADNLANVLQGIGVKQAMSGPRATILLGGHGYPPCPVTIYIDGMLYYTGRSKTRPPDVSSMFAIDFAGAEYYASGAEVPAQYAGTDTGCGMLLLWRKN